MNSFRLPLPRKGLLEKIHAVIGSPPVRLALESGESVGPPAGRALGAVVIRDDRTLLALCAHPDAGFGEAYTEGRARVEGDLSRVLEAVFVHSAAGRHSTWLQRLTQRIAKWTQRNTLRGSRRNIHHHYDLSNDFYRLWLDREMVYTCAYFRTPRASLEEAQQAKMEHVCRKLRLQPGERVLEAGCGWGSLALHMARNFGARVRAFNVSHEQIRYARERAKAEGLEGRVEFVEDDYRNASGEYDAFVSVGMLEHVGPENYDTLGRVIRRAIGDRGRGLLHFIARTQPRPVSPWLRKRIFPGSYVPTLRESLRVLEPFNFSVLDVENLRLHYAETLRHWLERFDAARAKLAPPLDDEKFIRAWRLYLAGVCAGFRSGVLQLFQVVFAGAAWNRLAWTRAPLYTDAPAEEPAVQPERQWIAAKS